MAALLAALVTAVLIAGCGGEQDAPPSPTAAPTIAPAPTPTAPPAPTQAPADTPTPSADSGPKVPGFSLLAADGSLVSLDDLLVGHEAVVLVFYRGSF